MSCETCKYCTEVGRNSEGKAVMRRCIRKNGLKYEDTIPENCPEYAFSDVPDATNSSKCMTCRFCTAIGKNDSDCAVTRKCNATGSENEDFVVFDCPVYQADGKKLIDIPDEISFGTKAPVNNKNTAPKNKKNQKTDSAEKEKSPEEEKKAMMKMILIICACFLALIIIIKIVTSSGLFGKKEKPQTEITTSGEYSQYTTDPNFTLPEITTEEPSYVTATMNEPAFITSDVGLKLRSSASTDSEELAIMPYMADLTILSLEDGWAFVDYNGMKGWCAEDYIEKGTIPTYSSDDVGASISAANNVIASYFNRPLNVGKTSLEPAYVITYFQEAEQIYNQFECNPGSIFDESHEDLKSTSETYTGKFFRVTDDKFTTVESLCEYFFSYFSDEVAKQMLNNKVFVINGNLYIHYGTVGVTHRKVLVEPTVKNELNSYTVELNVKLYNDPVDVNLKTSEYIISYPCSLLNGRWVFTHMESMPRQ